MYNTRILILASVVTLFNKVTICVFHRADMIVGTSAPLTFEILGISFLYDIYVHKQIN